MTEMNEDLHSGQGSNISFVVQGAVDKKNTAACLCSIRKHLPNAAIILSTWRGSDVSNLEYDELILSEDPGFFYYYNSTDEKNNKNNINRQLVSTLAGLKRVKTPYAFKMRTDFSLNGNSFLTYWGQFNKADDTYRIFGSKMLACSYFSQNSNRTYPWPFCPSDVCFFGKSEDLLNLFDIPLMTKEDAYWDKHNFHFNRYFPEQYIFINCLRKNGKKIECSHYEDNSMHNISETEKYFASNFIFLTFEQFNLVPSKKTFSMKLIPESFRTCYTHNEWLALYQRYVDPNIPIPTRDFEREKIERLFSRKQRKERFLDYLGRVLALPFPNRKLRHKIRHFIRELS